jgi:hypothetical protein
MCRYRLFLVTAPNTGIWKESGQEEDEEDNDDEYISDVEGDGKHSTAVGSPTKRSREGEGEEDGDEDEGQDAKKVKV